MLQSANSFTCAPVVRRDAFFSGCRCSEFNTDLCTGTSLYRSPACRRSLYSVIFSLRASRVNTFLWTQSWMSSASSELARPPEPRGGRGEGEEEEAGGLRKG